MSSGWNVFVQDDDDAKPRLVGGSEWMSVCADENGTVVSKSEGSYGTHGDFGGRLAMRSIRNVMTECDNT